ncbi:hypothetical protein F2Q68_00004523 [Brassica cretica]|uniref:Uncharacterized protein n=1 Tax=Brassica cretica TaxID=69181 RepID=A0A8S9JAX8_BRACR|nr:hypothetical protein F2Q68_00004523 [Brassica cretica]
MTSSSTIGRYWRRIIDRCSCLDIDRQRSAQKARLVTADLKPKSSPFYKITPDEPEYDGCDCSIPFSATTGTSNSANRTNLTHLDTWTYQLPLLTRHLYLHVRFPIPGRDQMRPFQTKHFQGLMADTRS